MLITHIGRSCHLWLETERMPMASLTLSWRPCTSNVLLLLVWLWPRVFSSNPRVPVSFTNTFPHHIHLYSLPVTLLCTFTSVVLLSGDNHLPSPLSYHLISPVFDVKFKSYWLEWSNVPGIYTKKQIDGWKVVTDAIHSEGSYTFAQLWHIGRVAHPLLQGNKPNVGPSAIGAKGGLFRNLPGWVVGTPSKFYYVHASFNTFWIRNPGYVTPVAIEDPWHYIGLYKQAAKNSLEAGFDGVELHAANGCKWPLTHGSFLS